MYGVMTPWLHNCELRLRLEVRFKKKKKKTDKEWSRNAEEKLFNSWKADKK